METGLEKELKLIRRRLDSIEEVLSEEMSENDKRAYADAIKEHKQGKSLPFVRSSKR